MNKIAVTLAILSTLVISVILPVAYAQAEKPTIRVSTYRSEYRLGDPVAVAVEVSTSASVIMNVQTPSGTVERDLGFVEITYGTWQTFVLNDVTTTPGTYTVQAEATFHCYGDLKETVSSTFVVREPGQITEVAGPIMNEAPLTTSKELASPDAVAQQTGLDVGPVSIVAAAVLLLSVMFAFTIRRRKA